jgi:hypothetical protein
MVFPSPSLDFFSSLLTSLIHRIILLIYENSAEKAPPLRRLP